MSDTDLHFCFALLTFSDGQPTGANLIHVGTLGECKAVFPPRVNIYQWVGSRSVPKIEICICKARDLSLDFQAYLCRDLEYRTEVVS